MLIFKNHLIFLNISEVSTPLAGSLLESPNLRRSWGWDGLGFGFTPAESLQDITGWWFGLFFIFPLILGMSSSQLTFIFFRGVAQPPTRSGCCENHGKTPHSTDESCIFLHIFAIKWPGELSLSFWHSPKTSGGPSCMGSSGSEVREKDRNDRQRQKEAWGERRGTPLGTSAKIAPFDPPSWAILGSSRHSEFPHGIWGEMAMHWHHWTRTAKLSEQDGGLKGTQGTPDWGMSKLRCNDLRISPSCWLRPPVLNHLSKPWWT